MTNEYTPVLEMGRTQLADEVVKLRAEIKRLQIEVDAWKSWHDREAAKLGTGALPEEENAAMLDVTDADVAAAIQYIEECQRTLPPGVLLESTQLLCAYRAKCAETEQLRARVKVKEVRYGWMCDIAFDYELGEAAGATAVFASRESLLKGHPSCKNSEYCVPVEVRVEKVAEEVNNADNKT